MKEDEEGTREEGKGREERKGMKIKGKTKDSLVSQRVPIEGN